MYFDTTPHTYFYKKKSNIFFNFLKVATGKFEVVVTVSLTP